MQEIQININIRSDVYKSEKAVSELAEKMNFEQKEIDLLKLVVSELAKNVLKHAGSGVLLIKEAKRNEKSGIVIETIDQGSGISDPESAIEDGQTGKDSLGYGLGAVNRIMDFLEVINLSPGARVTSVKWNKKKAQKETSFKKLDMGAASRPHPKMELNGDDFVLKSWGNFALACVIDGLGHGQFANRASSKARQYVATHYENDLEEIFRGTNTACKGTRGVVMAIAQFDLLDGTISYASIGNIGLRSIPRDLKLNRFLQRGIVGINMKNVRVSRALWDMDNILIMFSDGISTKWNIADYPDIYNKSANEIASKLLYSYAGDNDDATVVVIKRKL